MAFVKKSTILFVIILFASCTRKLQILYDDVDIEYYYRSDDYVQNKVVSNDIYTDIMFETEDFILISDLIDKESAKKNKKARKAWAIRYNSENYFNLDFQSNPNLRSADAYAKLDIEGDFCLIAIKTENLKALNKRGANYALMGVLGNELSKAKTRWNDDNMEYYNLIFINTTEVDGIHNSLGIELNRKNLNKLLGTNFDRWQLESLRVEDVFKILHAMN